MSKYTVSRLKVLKVMGESLAFYQNLVKETESEMASSIAWTDFDGRRYDMLRQRLEVRKAHVTGYMEAMNDLRFT